MEYQDLISTCEHNGFEWKEVEREGEKKVAVKCPWLDADPDKPEITLVDLGELGHITSRELVKFVKNGRDVLHLSRIVGYYSYTKNWNRSKRGELKARRSGQYVVPGNAGPESEQNIVE